jgi:transposase-like protein
MRRTRKRFSEDFKAKVALEAIKGEKTLAEIASHYEIHPNQVTQWKKRLEEGIPQLFSRNGDRHLQVQDELIDELYRQIGQLKVELDWVKKKSRGVS